MFYIKSDKDPQPHNRGLIDNFFAGSSDTADGYKPKLDDNPIIDLYLDKYKKTMPKKTDTDPLFEEENGISTERNDQIARYVRKFKKAFQPDPNALNEENFNIDDQLGTQPVDEFSASPYKNKNDSNRGRTCSPSLDNKKNKKIQLLEKNTEE